MLVKNEDSKEVEMYEILTVVGSLVLEANWFDWSLVIPHNMSMERQGSG